MDSAKDGHRGSDVPCPICSTPFWQRVDGRPKTCSRSCARKKDWLERERPDRIPAPGGYVYLRVPVGTPGVTFTLEHNAYIMEHRYVMAQTLGRPLLPWPLEHVHHRDGNRKNNDPPNLSLRTGATHGAGATTHCPTCTCDVSDDC